MFDYDFNTWFRIQYRMKGRSISLQLNNIKFRQLAAGQLSRDNLEHLQIYKVKYTIINFIFKMRPRMKVSLDDAKYIQSEIERILNLDEQSPNKKKGQHVNRNGKFSTLTPASKRDQSYDNRYKQGMNKSAFVTPDKNSANSRHSMTPPKSTQKRSTNKKNKSKSKSKKKKGQLNIQQPKTKRYFSPQFTQSSLHRIKQQKAQIREQEDQKKYKQSTVKQFAPSANLSIKQLYQKWSLFEKEPNRKIQDTKYNEKSSSPAEKKQKTKKKNEIQNKEKQAHSKSMKLTKNEQRQKIRKKYYPYGLTDFKQNKKQSLDSQRSADLLQSKQTEREQPQYLKKNNHIAIRDQGDFLSRKFQEKQDRNQKKKELILKYHVLDQRLNKIREQTHNNPVGKLFLRLQQQNRIKSRHSYKQALKSYLRFSPLKKLVKVNEKLKTQFQRSVRDSNDRDLNSKKVKQLFQEGRPLWNL